MEQAIEELDLRPPRSMMVRCPGHEDNTPSLRLYERDWYCFSCGKVGDAIGLIAWFTGRDVAQLLRERGGPYDKLQARKATRDLKVGDVAADVRRQYKTLHDWFFDEVWRIHKDSPQWMLLQSLEYWSEYFDSIIALITGRGLMDDEDKLTPYEAERMLKQAKADLEGGLRWEGERA